MFIMIDAVGLDCGRDYVGNLGLLLGQIGSKVHFLPAELLLDGDSGEAELGADSTSLHEVYHAI